jgi:hypothetical protein
VQHYNRSPRAHQPVSTACLSSPRWRQKVFTVQSREYQWIDAFLYAMVRGDWAAFEQQLYEGLACAAEAVEAEMWADEAKIDEAATAFRYDRDLLTTEETMAWLEHGGLTLEDWTDFIARSVLRNEWSGRLPTLVERHRAKLSVTDANFAAEGLCSPIFRQFAMTLAGRAAMAATLDPSEPVPAGRPFKIAKLVSRHAVWLDGFDSTELAERLSHLSRVETHFLASAEAAKTDQALALQVGRNRLEWMRVDLERLSFTDADAAREAALCVREDGLTLTDVGLESRQPIRDTAGILERLEPELRDAVLSGTVDELIGPIQIGDRFELATIVAKIPADVSDSLVRARAEEAVIEQMMSKAILAHVRWAERIRTPIN